MNYILIADAGSTTIDWALTSPDGSDIHEFKSMGLNAMQASADRMTQLFQDCAAKIPDGISIGEIFYYGAGCATPDVCKMVKGALLQAFGAGSAMVTTDLLGAARSLSGNKQGIDCILGTGSNSCRFNGATIADNIPPLGFILGDEGSGAALGKRLLADAFKGALPASLKSRLIEKYDLSLDDILRNVYRCPAPSRFLASFVPFIADNIWNPYLYAMVRKEFLSFFERNVLRYPDALSIPVNFTGSIAWHFRDILKDAARELGITIGVITQSPIKGLIAFHTSNI